ncbi:sulfatase [Rhodopirellula sp. MGV]|uniref:sulfatase family protein n=1 Tax=Rhodopirellula sp. MGV TaxID=2023130 RepID=UPI000B96CCBA|nr:sulfatase [Rhodopirellula sp. MGV]OYP38861.1 hypothetical protein CGZ80_01180 [Rhodopirellula sp. MGV]PNY37671.1 DUF4976 domain-containing protein [Rhodopirellula baltica]
MQRFTFVITTFVLIAGNCLISPTAKAETAKRPNIVMIYTDDQCFASLGATGNSDVRTPNMDQLAADGIPFRRHYNSTAICMGSRASVLTGMYEYKTGCNFDHGPMYPELFQQSYPVLLRNAGYRTGFGGKFGFAVTESKSEADGSYDVLPVNQFDSWAGGTGQTNYQTAKNKYLAKYADRYPHSTRAYGAFATDFIGESKSDARPFCLTLFFKAPHRPFTPDPFFDEVYRDVTFSKPENYGRDAAQHLSKQSRLGRQYLTFFHDMGFDPKRYQATMRKYHQLIYGVDYAIGMVRQALRDQGVEDNTVIILTSDNGFFCGAHGMGGKVLPYEEGSKVPLIVYDPRDTSNSPSTNSRQCDELTMTTDIAPTILDLAGQAIPAQIDGRSLKPLLVDSNASLSRESIPLFQMWGAPPTFSMSVVTQKYKYVYWCFGGGMEPAEELFDLKSDPLEMVNIVGDPKHQDQLARLRQRYAEQLKHLQANAVDRHDYRPFATLLDPAIEWDAKAPLVTERMWRHSRALAKQLGVAEQGIAGDQSFDFDQMIRSAQ